MNAVIIQKLAEAMKTVSNDSKYINGVQIRNVTIIIDGYTETMEFDLKDDNDRVSELVRDIIKDTINLRMESLIDSLKKEIALDDEIEVS